MVEADLVHYGKQGAQWATASFSNAAVTLILAIVRIASLQVV